MKKVRDKLVFLLILAVILSVGIASFISANSVGVSINGPKTIVTGTVYYAENNQPIPDAEVTLKCKSNVKVIKRKLTTDSDGTYYTVFEHKDCKENSLITVSASKDGVTGENDGLVEESEVKKIDIAVVNVPLVPEFGTAIGILTILGALGVFFVVRRK